VEQRYFVAEHLNKGVCQQSSSGGMFTAITDAWFQMHGSRAVVYGCVLGQDMKARHVRAVTREQRDAMRGSKYIGSDMSGVIRQAIDDLRNGFFVAFSGTPCQMAGMNAVVKATGVDQDQLLTIEVLCHGVGSVTYFQDYIADKEKKYRSKAVACSFRGKRRPGKKAQMVVGFENGKEYESPSVKYDGFMAAYYRNYSLRPACFSCPYTTVTRQADLTIADFHESEPQSTYGAGSTIIVHTDKGEGLFLRAGQDIACREVELSRIMQPHMKVASKVPKNYGEFWNVYRSGGYAKALAFLGLNTTAGKILSLMATVAYKLHLVEALKGLRKKLRSARRK